MRCVLARRLLRRTARCATLCVLLPRGSAAHARAFARTLRDDARIALAPEHGRLVRGRPRVLAADAARARGRGPAYGRRAGFLARRVLGREDRARRGVSSHRSADLRPRRARAMVVLSAGAAGRSFWPRRRRRRVRAAAGRSEVLHRVAARDAHRRCALRSRVRRSARAGRMVDDSADVSFAHRGRRDDASAAPRGDLALLAPALDRQRTAVRACRGCVPQRASDDDRICPRRRRRAARPRPFAGKYQPTRARRRDRRVDDGAALVRSRDAGRRAILRRLCRRRRRDRCVAAHPDAARDRGRRRRVGWLPADDRMEPRGSPRRVVRLLRMSADCGDGTARFAARAYGPARRGGCCGGSIHPASGVSRTAASDHADVDAVLAAAAARAAARDRLVRRIRERPCRRAHDRERRVRGVRRALARAVRALRAQPAQHACCARRESVSQRHRGERAFRRCRSAVFSGATPRSSRTFVVRARGSARAARMGRRAIARDAAAARLRRLAGAALRRSRRTLAPCRRSFRARGDCLWHRAGSRRRGHGAVRARDAGRAGIRRTTDAAQARPDPCGSRAGCVVAVPDRVRHRRRGRRGVDEPVSRRDPVDRAIRECQQPGRAPAARRRRIDDLRLRRLRSRRRPCIGASSWKACRTISISSCCKRDRRVRPRRHSCARIPGGGIRVRFQLRAIKRNSSSAERQ